jgi:cell division protein FtsZ
MGGGTCTELRRLLLKLPKKNCILTIAVVTKPFMFEGTRRMTNPQEGISQLRNNVD